ncbi:hypothetical protein WA158_001496 [Blastocystis sp. Blastoise]
MFKYLLHHLELQDFNILNSFKVFLMDCDGVIWKGSESIPRVVDAINYMKVRGKKFYYISNDCINTREDYVEKLNSFGINANLNEVITSASATANYLQSSKLNKKPYIIGEKGILRELEKIGISYYSPEIIQSENKDKMLNELKNDIGSVILEIDSTQNIYNNTNNNNLTQYLSMKNQKNQYINPFIVTCGSNTMSSMNNINSNKDSLLSMIQTTTLRSPDIVIGKSSNYILQMVKQDAGCEMRDIIMVGDSLQTDVLFAKNNHIPSICVLSGVTKEETLSELTDQQEIYKPEYYAEDFATVGDIIMWKYK